MLTCLRCYTIQPKEELVICSKIKGCSIEFSRKFKGCKKCECRVFYNYVISIEELHTK